jgi:integrase
MKQKPRSRVNRKKAKTVLRLPDLEHAKAAVLNSLTSADAQRGYRHAIDEFVDWYCSEPRLAFNRIVVLRYRSYLESRQLAPGTVNLRLGAMRRLAYEAADCGLLSSDLAAGIRRVKGVKKLGVRLGNWLTVEQAHSLWRAPDSQGLKGKRDRALLALLLACGLRRHEAVGLRIDDLQEREEHWAIVDLVGKAGHVRTVPIPDWVKGQLDEWLRSAGIARGRIFRRVTRMGRPWGDCMTEKSIWHIVKDCAKGIGMPKLPLMTCGGRALVCAMLQEANWNRSSSCWDMSRFKQPSDTLAASSGFGRRSMIASESNQIPESRGSGRVAEDSGVIA